MYHPVKFIIVWLWDSEQEDINLKSRSYDVSPQRNNTFLYEAFDSERKHNLVYRVYSTTKE